jgi:hypothetical protein
MPQELLFELKALELRRTSPFPTFRKLLSRHSPFALGVSLQ